jgi:hypothetical protein
MVENAWVRSGYGSGGSKTTREDVNANAKEGIPWELIIALAFWSTSGEWVTSIHHASYSALFLLLRDVIFSRCVSYTSTNNFVTTMQPGTYANNVAATDGDGDE